MKNIISKLDLIIENKKNIDSIESELSFKIKGVLKGGFRKPGSDNSKVYLSLSANLFDDEIIELYKFLKSYLEPENE